MVKTASHTAPVAALECTVWPSGSPVGPPVVTPDDRRAVEVHDVAPSEFPHRPGGSVRHVGAVVSDGDELTHFRLLGPAPFLRIAAWGDSM
ncbi:hypothetical protein [Streptomyces sp. bgisy060]|uniref:hypothetical protein n=1 Tax=Streptomyces sp. bgisy060 TaxID=3413775 RepID=UPI003EBFCE6D